MATTIDQKIVEMKFDNRDFERNTRTTMSTLDRLKAKLNFDGASKGLENVGHAAKNVDMSGLATGITTVQSKFSAMEVVGITALANITNSAINAGKQLIKSFTIDPVSSGWGKMGQMMGSVQTLVNSTGKSVDEIEGYLDELMWYSDETSYGFNDMTAALANMTATGGDINKLVPMIRGMANAVAFAGKGASEFSRVIFNLNQSYGAGYLQLNDWKSVQMSGANSKQLVEELIKAGEELGKIKKGAVTIGTFNETLKDKWVTTSVMEKAFGRFDKLSALAYKATQEGLTLADGTIMKFDTASKAIDYLSEHCKELGIEYDELAFRSFRAAQEAKTFGEAIESTADATSSAWMKVFKAIFGNYNEQKRIFTDLANFLYDVFVNPIYTIEEIVRNAFDFSGFEKMWKKITDNSLFKAIDKVNDKLQTTTRTLEEYQAIVKKVWRGDFKNVGDNPDRYDSLTKAGWDPRIVQDLVNKTDKIAGRGKGWTVIDQLTIDDVRKSEEKYGVTVTETTEAVKDQTEATKDLEKKLQNLTKEELEKLGLSEEEIRMYQSLQRASKKYGKSMSEIIEMMKNAKGRDLVFGGENVTGIFQNISVVLGSIVNVGKKAWREVFAPFGGAELYMILHNLNEFTIKLMEVTANEKGMTNLKDTFKGLFAILKLVTIFVGGGAKIAFVIFKTVLETLGVSILDFTGAIGNLISKFVDFITKNNHIIEGVKGLTKTISDSIITVYQWIQSHISLNGVLHNVEDTLNKLKKAFVDWWQGAKDAKAQGQLGQYLINTFVNVFDKVKNWLKTNGGNFINWLSETFGSLGGKLGEFFKGLPGAKEAGQLGKYLIDGLVNGITSGGNKLWEGIKWIANIIIGTFQGIFKIHSPSKVMEEEGSYLMQGLWNGIKGFAGYIYELFKTIGAKIIDIIKDIDLGSIFVAAISAGGIFAFIKIAKAVTILADGLQNLKDVINEFRKTLNVFQGVLKAFKVKIITSALKDVAISVAILVASIWVLTKLDVGQVWASIGAIAALIAILVGLTALAGYLGGKGGAMEFGKLALTILAIGVAMGLMASALKKVAEIDKAAWGTIAAFGGMIVAFIGIMWLVTKSDKDSVKMGVTLLAIAGVFYIMAKVVKAMGKLKPDELKQGMIALGIFTLLIVGLMAATKLIAGSKNVEKIGGALLAISAAFYLMGRVVKTLGKMKPDELKQGILALTGFEIMIISLMASTKLIAGSKNIDKMGKSLVAIGGAFLLMALSVRILGKMESEDLIKGGLVVAAFTAMIIGLMYAMKKIGVQAVTNLGKTLLGVAAAIGVMALSVGLLSLIKWQALAKATAAVGLLSLFVMGIIHATKGAQNVSKNLFALTAVIAALAISIGVLSLINPEKLIGPVASMAILMGMFALILNQSKNLKTADFKNLLVLTGVVALMAGIVVGLSFINADAALKSVLSISLLLVSMTAALFLLEKMGGITTNAAKGLLGLAGLLLVLLGVVGILKLMSGIPNAGKNALVLATFLGALTVCLLLTAAVGAIYAATGGLAATGLLGLAALLLVLLGVIGILALMNNLQNADTNMNMLIGFMNTMTEMLVKIGIIGPLALAGVAAMAGLTALMGAMLIFATAIGALVTYLPSIKTFMDNGLSLLVDLAGRIGEMIGAFVNGILTQISAGLPEIGTNLSRFMISIMPFIIGAKMVDGDVLRGVGVLSASIILLSAAELIQGITKFLSGGKGFAEMGTELSKFMIAALPFLMIASTLNERMMNGVKSLSSAILTLTAAELLQGIINFLTRGRLSLSEFGKQLPELGTNLAGFVKNLGEFSEGQVTTVECAGRAIEALAESAKKLPNEGGWVAKILGDNSLAKFSKDLPGIGTNIKEFVQNLGEFSQPQINTAECACKVITALADAADKIPNEGGLWAKLFGDNSLVKFAKSMPDVADGVNKFVEKLDFSDDKTARVNAAADVIKGLAELGQLDLKKAKDNLPEFGERLSGFGENLKKFISNVSDFSQEKMETASNNLKIVIEAVKNLMATIKDTANDNSNQIVTTFEDISYKAAQAINSNKVKTELSTQATNFVQGFANGIKNNESLATTAANTLGINTSAQLKKALNEHSPSKVTHEIGNYFGEGFIIGIEEYATKVYDISSEIGSEAKHGLTNAIAKMSSLVNSDMDVQPTIRPVLDLSEVNNGFNRIDSMFGNKNLSVMSNLNAISSSMNSRIQNGNNADVVSAINKLGKNIGNTGNTYNINGVTYDDGSNVSQAVETLLRAINVERRS